MTEPSPILTTQQLAAKLGISIQRVRRMVREWGLPAGKVYKHNRIYEYVIALADFDHWRSEWKPKARSRKVVF